MIGFPAVRTTLLPPVLAAALVLGGCGGDGDSASPETAAGPAPVPTVSESRPLTPAEIRVITRAQRRVAAYCRRLGRSLGGGGRPPTEADLNRAIAELDRLAALAGRAPTAETIDGTTPRLALGDIAENLEGTNCDTRLVAHIDAALTGLPAG